MQIAFVAGREAGYSRNRLLLRALRDAGHEVIEGPQCRPPFGGGQAYLFLRGIRAKVDMVFLGFFAQHLAHAARAAVGKKPIVMDAFVSAYDTLVTDRQVLRPTSMISAMIKNAEIGAVRLCDHVLTDTHAHRMFFIDYAGVSPERISVLPVGTDADLFKSATWAQPARPLRVHFHGDAQRLHGLDVVMQAVRSFTRSNLTLRLVGRGKDYERWLSRQGQNLPEVVDLSDPVPYAELPSLIRDADVCLGIFGSGEKAQRVIPNKVYEAAACGRASISLLTPAMNEVFRPGISYIPCDGSPENLAHILRGLSDAPATLGPVGKAARADYEAHASRGVQREILQSVFQSIEANGGRSR